MNNMTSARGGVRIAMGVSVTLCMLFTDSGASAGAFLPNPEQLAEYLEANPDAGTAFRQYIETHQLILDGHKYVVWDDVLFDYEQVKAAGGLSANIWPGREVFYAVDCDVTEAEEKIWDDAATVWASTKCVTFTKVAPDSKPSMVTVMHGKVDYSYGIGQGKYEVTIKNWHIKTVTHEMGHVLGLIHEHLRCDRDGFVEIDKTLWCKESKFEAERYSLNMGDYDLCSIMHYSRDQCSSGGNSLVPRPPNIRLLNVMGTRSTPSQGDFNAIIAAYCDGKPGKSCH